MINIDEEIAAQYGLNIIIFCSKIADWLRWNKANNRNFHDGRYWTFNSLDALKKLFPFWTVDQIRKVIKDSISIGLIVKGNYNKSKYDQTLWYSLTDLGTQVFKIPSWEIPQINAGNSPNQIGENPRPIPIHKPIHKPTKDKIYCSSNDERVVDNSDCVISENSEMRRSEETFEQFWQAYPRKEGRKAAYKSWVKNKLHDKADIIISDVNNRTTKLWFKKDKSFIPHASTYLNGERWNDEILQPTPIQGIQYGRKEPTSAAKHFDFCKALYGEAIAKEQPGSRYGFNPAQEHPEIVDAEAFFEVPDDMGKQMG